MQQAARVPSLRIDVKPAGDAFLATSAAPPANAIGSTPSEAAEGARLMAISIAGDQPAKQVLITYSAPGITRIVLQPIDRIVPTEALVKPQSQPLP